MPHLEVKAKAGWNEQRDALALGAKLRPVGSVPPEANPKWMGSSSQVYQAKMERGGRALLAGMTAPVQTLEEYRADCLSDANSADTGLSPHLAIYDGANDILRFLPIMAVEERLYEHKRISTRMMVVTPEGALLTTLPTFVVWLPQSTSTST